jgi:hypothetical protein
MYIVIPTPGHVSTDEDGDAFHDNFTYKGNNKGVYAVYYGKKDLEWITRTLAHEIAEACTNPVYNKKAFIDPDVEPPDNEIADFCENEVGEVKRSSSRRILV